MRTGNESGRTWVAATVGFSVPGLVVLLTLPVATMRWDEVAAPIQRAAMAVWDLAPAARYMSVLAVAVALAGAMSIRSSRRLKVLMLGVAVMSVVAAFFAVHYLQTCFGPA